MILVLLILVSSKKVAQFLAVKEKANVLPIFKHEAIFHLISLETP